MSDNAISVQAIIRSYLAGKGAEMTATAAKPVKWPQYEACSSCGGHGLVYDGEDITTCRKCGGNGREIARDDKGRFLPWEFIL